MLKIKIHGLKEELDGQNIYIYESRIWLHGWKVEHGKQETSKTTKQDQMKYLCINKEISYFHSK